LTKRILVVDDEPTIRELVADALREAGYHIDTAANGADALQLMLRHAPHAIVLDLMMPTLDGNGFVELKRLNPRFATIPILMVTAAYGAYDAAERLGASACLTKPFELDELVGAIDRLVGGDARPGRAATPAAPNGSLERPTLAEA
jgi:DNA-binding response OmpR family regulator